MEEGLQDLQVGQGEGECYEELPQGEGGYEHQGAADGPYQGELPFGDLQDGGEGQFGGDFGEFDEAGGFDQEPEEEMQVCCECVIVLFHCARLILSCSACERQTECASSSAI